MSFQLETRDEIYSAMVVYGLLAYADGQVSIPNKELTDSFASNFCEVEALQQSGTALEINRI